MALDFRLQRRQYLKEIKKILKRGGEDGNEHPLMMYRPVDIKFVALGGQSKIFSFHSETLERDMILKLYDWKYSR